ncbi:pyrroline-5-carboxylate dehydrogenase rocA [Mycobacterium tuberculosis]|nr:pyrroline-5-carboxylate dehydrogenase rocA [Mycobacterium tuberculosis]
MDAITQVPVPANEPVHDYAPKSPERTRLRTELASLADHPIDLPHVIGGRHRMGDGERIDVVQPHRHAARLGTLTNATHADAAAAVEAAMSAKSDWAALPFDERAAVFLRAADLLAGPWREKIAAATMLGQSKSVYQAEIDAVCELIDFWRFNVAFARQILEQQPISGPGEWNRIDYRPLDGFVYAITPFNFTSIAGNLPTAPALMGNTVIWKPSITQTLAAYLTMQLLEAAGLPPGVINLVTGDGFAVSDVALADPRLAGIHFTGSTATFGHLWQWVGTNIGRYHSYPRLVGETGGKDFVVAHASARPDVLRTALIRGAFDYQGQKCSAVSRAFIAHSVWQRMGDELLAKAAELRYGDITDLSNYGGALIDQRAFVKNVDAIERAKGAAAVTVAVGGEYDDSEGYFVRPGVALRRPDRRVVCHRVLRSAAVGACLPRRALRADPRRHRHRIPLRADRRGHRRRPAGRADRAGSAAVRGGELLCQRQADGGGGGASAVRRCTRIGHQRQGRFAVEPAAVDVGAQHQGDVRRGHRPHLPAHGGRLMAGWFAHTLRPAMLAAGRSDRLGRIVERSPLTRGVVRRFVPGDTLDDVVDIVTALRDSGRYLSIDYLGENVTDADDAAAAVRAYLGLLDVLGRRGDIACDGVRPLEVSLKLSALGQALDRDGQKIALDNARAICERAERVGAWVTVDAEDHTTTDSTLSISGDLRVDFPWLGTVVQAYLRRTLADCAELAAVGARVRLCKGAYDEPASVAYRDAAQVTDSYLRCLRVLTAGRGYPMVATHDPVIIAAVPGITRESGRSQGDFEYQMLYGVRDDEQRRLTGAGNHVRVYVPFGTRWYGYFLRRLAERPANLAFFLRALTDRRRARGCAER